MGVPNYSELRRHRSRRHRSQEGTDHFITLENDMILRDGSRVQIELVGEDQVKIGCTVVDIAALHRLVCLVTDGSIVIQYGEE